MAKRRLRGLFDSNPKRSTAIDEALESVRAAAPAGDDQPEATGAKQEVDKGTQEAGTPEAEAKGLPAQGILTPEELAARLGDDDAAGDSKTAPEALKDPTAGFESARGRLADQLGSADPSDTVKSGEASDRGKDSSMIADQVVQGFLSPPEGKITDEGDVTGSSTGGTTARQALGDLPIVGKYLEGAFESAEQSGAGYQQRVDEAADSDPTSVPGGGDSSTGSTETDDSAGTDSAGTGETGTDSAGTGESGVMHEYDNDDGSHTTVYNDGTIITTSEDGQEVNYPDGTTEYYDSEGNLVGVEDESEEQSQEPEGSSEEGDDAPPAGEEEGEDEGEGDGEAGDEGEAEGEGEEGGGVGMEGDPVDGEGTLPEELQQWIDTDLAAMKQRLQPVGSGDGVTDPDPNAEPVTAVGPVPDAHAELESMLGRPGDPDDMYGTGAGVDPGSAPPQDSGVIDPGPDADTGVPTMGPEERTTGGSVAGLRPPAKGSADSEDDSTDDASDSISDLAIQSPLRDVIGPVRLAAGDDASEGLDDADD